MGKKIISYILVTFFLIQVQPVYAQYTQTYDYVRELAYKALEKNFLDDALHYFRVLNHINPSAREPLEQIEHIINMKRISAETFSYQPLDREQEFFDDRSFLPDQAEEGREISAYKKKTEETMLLPKVIIREQGAVTEKPFEKKKSEPEFIRKYREPSPVRPEAVSPYEPSLAEEPLVIRGKTPASRTLYLTDELFARQPKTEIQIAFNDSLIIEGKSIKRFLVIDPDVLDIERISDKEISLYGKSIGTTLIHIWDETTRWTFTIKVIPARIIPKAEKEELKDLYYADPFKVFYNAEWRNYSRGRRLDSLDRETLSFDQNLGFYGDTPYGILDGSMRYAKYGSKYELTNYTLGLSSGKWKNFENFNLRVFDVYKSFSELSYPGGLLRGAYWEADAFNKILNYALIWGEEREGYYGYYTPGILEGRESNIEGIQLKLFPYEQTNFTFNYLHGYGSGREDYLGNDVYSLQVSHSQAPMSISSEIASNNEAYAGYLDVDMRLKAAHLYANLRNIEKNFTTINGRPGDLGELGMILGLNMPLDEDNFLTASLDIYRDRYFYNQGTRDDLNFDLQATLSSILDDNSSLYSSFYYNNDPQLSFPRRYLSLRSTYSRNFTIFADHILNTFLGAGYQKSRNPLSPSSDYDVLLSTMGTRYYLTKALSYYLNFSYHWLDEISANESFNPYVYETGFDYHRKFSPKLTADLRLYFRDEEETEAVHSFLAGEDSIETSARLSYYLNDDVELYLDGRIRNVWAEAADTEKYVESELRLGINSTWDTFFSFSPTGMVSGYVFRDANANGEMDNGESPLKDIMISVGDRKLTTDSTGYYGTRIKARKAAVKIAPESLPEGYVLTSAYSRIVDIVQDGEAYVDFGLNTSASIHGAVFYDQNGNGNFDSSEKGVANVRVTLGDKTLKTNSNGRYYFRGLSPGKYTISIDINSIPIEYLPKIKLSKEIELGEGVNYVFLVPLTRK